MKKLISSIVSISMLAASAAVPVFADYQAPEDSYDVEVLNYTYDDGTVTNDIDGSQAKQITDSERVVELSDSTIMTNDFYLSFDFRFDSAADESVPGSIGIDRRKSNGDVNKQGPLFSYSEGKLRTQTGGSSFSTICDISADKWYTAELEGKMVVASASVTMTVYDDTHNEVAKVDGLNLRQFYASSNNGNPDTMRASNVSLDNIKLVSENLNAINITANKNEISASDVDPLDYTMVRGEKEMTKYAVDWSVYDENNENEITDGSVSITSEGVLTPSVSSPNQTVTVRASKVFGEKELIGTKQIKINSVDISGEKFDSITVSGDSSVKAGTSVQYSYTAMNGETDVTDTLTDSDVVWSIYDCDGLMPNNNKAIKIENGLLTVDKGVIPQKIYVRASSVSGNVYGSAQVEIGWAESQEEAVLAYNACEESLSGAERVDSIDGSNAYFMTGDTAMCKFTNTTDYTLTEFDLKFAEDGSGGFTLIRQDDGKQDLQVSYSDGTIRTQTGGSSYKPIISDAKPDTWYHFELIYCSAEKDISCIITPYNEDGTLGEGETALGIGYRNGDTYGAIKIWKSTTVDNIKISTPSANQVSLTSPGQYIFAGNTAQFTATATRNGLPIKTVTGLTWQILDSEKLPILDSKTLSISDSGLLSVDATAEAQTVTVRASSPTGAYSDADIAIQISEIFTVKNIGVNEAKTKIEKLYVDKNFYYDNEVTFFIAVKNADGMLKAVKAISTYGDNLSLGENELAAELELPSDFNPETDKIETMVWTSF